MKIFFSEKINLLPFLLIFCLLLPSCTRGGADIELIFSDFQAEIEIRRNQEIFTANIEVSALADRHRNARLEFISPECMSGLSVSLSDGVAESSFGGAPLGDTPDEYLRIISLLSPVGSFELLSKTEREICYSCGSARWYFDAVSKLPTVIENEQGAKIKINSIKRK